MKNIKLKDYFYTFWLIVISIYVGMIYSRQTKGLEKLDYSVTNQDTLKKNQDTILFNKFKNDAANLMEIVTKKQN